MELPHLGHGFEGAFRFFAILILQNCVFPVQ